MSQKEFQRMKVIENAADGRLSVRSASRLLQLSERQVQRLKRRYQPDSVDWVQHGNRGRSVHPVNAGEKRGSEMRNRKQQGQIIQMWIAGTCATGNGATSAGPCNEMRLRINLARL